MISLLSEYACMHLMLLVTVGFCLIMDALSDGCRIVPWSVA